jgi:hypothetical protein
MPCNRLARSGTTKKSVFYTLFQTINIAEVYQMKTKKINKKLELNKKTITNLGNDEMRKVQGGGITFKFSCACSLVSCVICP